MPSAESSAIAQCGQFCCLCSRLLAVKFGLFFCSTLFFFFSSLERLLDKRLKETRRIVVFSLRVEWISRGGYSFCA